MNQTRQAELLALADKVLIKNYRQQPIVLSHGSGMHLWDTAGNRYLDMTSGIAVCCLGHAHPALVRALSEQAGRLLHTSNLYFIEQQVLAAKAITDRCFGERVFFCNSGAEANEAALKLARRYQHQIAGQPGKNTIVATLGSFHGRSIATVSITGQEKYRQGFGPLFGPVEFVPYGELEAMTQVVERGDVCAVILEPIQAEGGIIVAPEGYLRGVRELADRTGTILIFDEVQTGVGRTGAWFGHQHDGVEPDVMTMAKALGGGVPVGALVASERAAAGLGSIAGGAVPHASTFGGNAFACAAINAVIGTIEADGLVASTAAVGAHLGRALDELVLGYPGQALEARGRGLLRGLRVAGNAAAVVSRCREKGVLLSVAGSDVVRFVPALIATAEHVDEAVSVLGSVLGEAA